MLHCSNKLSSWLVLEGQDEEAKNVIAALADLPLDHHLVRVGYTEIKDTVAEAANYGYRDLFTMGPDRHFHRVLLAYFSQVFQQISGINLITYYAATIFEKYIGLDGQTSRILAAANGTEYFLSSFVAVWGIERFGRRDLMLVGIVGMILSMTILAIMTYLSESKVGGSKPGIVSAVFLFAFNTFFAIGWLGIPCKIIFHFSISNPVPQFGTQILYFPIETTTNSAISQGSIPLKLYPSKFVPQPMVSPHPPTGYSISWL